jgi:hypothetical protein
MNPQEPHRGFADGVARVDSCHVCASCLNRWKACAAAASSSASSRSRRAIADAHSTSVPTPRSRWNLPRLASAALSIAARSSAAARSRMRPRTSSPVPSLFDERADAGRAFLQSRRLRREQVFRHATTCRCTTPSRQSIVVIGALTAKSRHWMSSDRDQQGRAANQRGEIVLGFGDTEPSS